jgi:hypothetical protein
MALRFLCRLRLIEATLRQIAVEKLAPKSSVQVTTRGLMRRMKTVIAATHSDGAQVKAMQRPARNCDRMQITLTVFARYTQQPIPN